MRQLDYSVLQQCIHCGMCLPTCPTYDVTKHETSSPRGRIALMRAVADGKLTPNSAQFADEMYFCLGCLACETACPAGVNYAEMIEFARAEVELSGAKAGAKRNLIRAVALRWLFAKPGRLRFVARLMRMDQRTGLSAALSRLFPKRLRDLRAIQPRIAGKFSFDLIRETESPTTPRRHRVALLTGCVQDVAYASVNRDTVDVLLANGCEVVTPRAQGCCGSLMGHNGELELARRLARQNLDVFPLENLDAIIVNSAGCGSFMKRYGHLLPDDPRAKVWDKTVCDIHEWLAKIGPQPLRPSSPRPHPLKVTYHEACHLVHGQRISQQPREMLRAIPGVELVELPEAAWCCGSAGIYNITQPEMSMALLERKMKHIAATGVAVVATGNPGCIGQIRCGAQKFGLKIEVVHPVTLLAKAYRGEL
ncbi:MAG TPA: (Fe-S)-binding protein [Verrucomicrobiae bacterium]|nr:(Fe-S)-binding protein [Verrucomicrobiae bacterium]